MTPGIDTDYNKGIVSVSLKDSNKEGYQKESTPYFKSIALGMLAAPFMLVAHAAWVAVALIAAPFLAIGWGVNKMVEAVKNLFGNNSPTPIYSDTGNSHLYSPDWLLPGEPEKRQASFYSSIAAGHSEGHSPTLTPVYDAERSTFQEPEKVCEMLETLSDTGFPRQSSV